MSFSTGKVRASLHLLPVAHLAAPSSVTMTPVFLPATPCVVCVASPLKHALTVSGPPMPRGDLFLTRRPSNGYSSVVSH